MSIRALKKCRRWSDQDALCQREHWQRISLSTKSSQVLDGSSNESDSYTAIRHRRGPKIRKKVSRPSLACHSLCVTWGQRSTNSDSLNGRRYFGDFVERMAVVKFETNLKIECFSRSAAEMLEFMSNDFPCKKTQLDPEKNYLSIPRASVITAAKISPVSSAFNESNSLTIKKKERKKNGKVGWWNDSSLFGMWRRR